MEENNMGKKTLSNHGKFFDERRINFVALVVSVVALICTWQIAENQRKVALFEKRIEMYQSISEFTEYSRIVTLLSEQSEDVNNLEVLLRYVNNLVPEAKILSPEMFGKEEPSEIEKLQISMNALRELDKFCLDLESSQYIFDLDDRQKEGIDKAVEKMRGIKQFVFEEKSIDNNMASYLKELSNQVVNLNIVQTMQDNLDLRIF